jgi:signal transduction histidine kinase
VNLKSITLKQIFFLALLLGLIALTISCSVLLKQQRDLTYKKWQHDTIRRSTAITASYYANIVTKLVSGTPNEIKRMLETCKTTEQLKSIDIVKPQNLTASILATCDVDTSLSIVHPVPTCYTRISNSFIIYHELRSAGYTVGYLKKTSDVPKLGFFINQPLVASIGIVIACFILVIGIALFFLHYHFTLPIRYLVKILKHNNNEEIPFEKFRVLELQTLAATVNNWIKTTKKNQQQEERLQYEVKLITLSKQLSHDIRSPLAALRVVKEMSDSSLEPDVVKLLTMSIDRITDIANTILPKGIKEVSALSDTESSFIWMLSDQIISEKRVEYKNANNVSIQFHVEGSPFELSAICNPSEFMRSISNMINNSIEARVPNKPIHVDLKLYSTQDNVLLSIIDNGKGIDSEVLPKVFEESFSHGKSQGTGLGLFQVKQAVELWKGRIQIESQIGIGTKIILELKKSPKPQWLADSILIKQYDSIVILDDEEYVFTILQDRFSEHFKSIRYFKQIEKFEANLPQVTNALLFIDHDLKQSANGIDLIQKHQLQQRSILLTGNYDDKQVQQRAAQNNIKILPKPLINDIPIIF